MSYAPFPEFVVDEGYLRDLFARQTHFNVWDFRRGVGEKRETKGIFDETDLIVDPYVNYLYSRFTVAPVGGSFVRTFGATLCPVHKDNRRGGVNILVHQGHPTTATTFHASLDGPALETLYMTTPIVIDGQSWHAVDNRQSVKDRVVFAIHFKEPFEEIRRLCLDKRLLKETE